MQRLKIEYIKISDLQRNPRNPRTHSKKQIRQLAESIKNLGWGAPVLIDENNFILGGHGRVDAAGLNGMTEVPCVRLENMTPAQKRAYALADNRHALNAGWDYELVAHELNELLAMDPEFEIADTIGFDQAEIDALIEGLALEEHDNPKLNQVPEDAPRRCYPGDIWQLGPHRLVCADAHDAHALDALMDGERARMVFTDPPYNVPIKGNVSGRGTVKHGDFAMASGEMSPEQFTAFLRTSCGILAKHSVDGAIIDVCMDWRHMREIQNAAEGIFNLKNVCVWVKDNGGMGTFYRSRYELVFVFKLGTARHLNNFELGQHGRYRTNVWEYAGVNTRKPGRLDELALHPTVKPADLIADAIKDVSPRGGIVLDIFGGSGSTLIAAHQTGRLARIVEIDPIYCDRILLRWEIFAKDTAELVASGLGRRVETAADAGRMSA